MNLFVMRNKLVMFGILLLVFGVAGLVVPSSALAVHDPLTLIPNPNGWVQTVPTPIYRDMRNSNHGSLFPSFFTWVSPDNNSATQSMTINYGQREVNLRLNLAGVVSRTPSQVVRTNYRITDVSGGGPVGNSQGPGSFSVGNGNLEGRERQLVFAPNHNQLGRYEYNHQTFQFAPGDPDGNGPLRGFVREGTYNIVLKTKTINRFQRSDGSFVHRCVPSGGEVASIDSFANCPKSGWQFQLRINIDPPPDYDNRSLLQLCNGNESPQGGEVVRGGVYKLCARSTNTGTGATLGDFTLAVRNQTPSQVNNAEVGNLTPAGNRFTYLGTNKGYRANNSDCSPGGGSNQDCWFWWFQNVVRNGQVNSNFEFRVRNTAPIDSPVCFQPFVRRRAPSGTGSQFHSGNQMCFTVVSPNCPASSDYPGQLIANQPDRNGDGIIDNRDCNNPPRQPYLKVYGNDVMAGGGGFGTGSCSILNPQASIESFATSEVVGLGPDTNWKGSSSQFGAFALGSVEGFFSASMRGPTGDDNLPRPPLDLTFGNTTDGTSKVTMNQGGNSGQSNCITDYFARGADTAQTGPQQINGNTTITGQEARYVEGNVFINGTGIRFQNSVGGWGNLVDNIPSFFLIVKGNIYIGPSVDRLDGVYVAQPTESDDGTVTGGIINTCSTNGSDLGGIGACNRKLEINGAFIARQVKFKRTGGNLADATANEVPTSLNIAEVFNFSPEVYLSPLHSSLRTSAPFTKYDYITSLPPIL